MSDTIFLQIVDSSSLIQFEQGHFEPLQLRLSLQERFPQDEEPA